MVEAADLNRPYRTDRRIGYRSIGALVNGVNRVAPIV